jgi:hypothetical protein
MCISNAWFLWWWPLVFFPFYVGAEPYPCFDTFDIISATTEELRSQILLQVAQSPSKSAQEPMLGEKTFITLSQQRAKLAKQIMRLQEKLTMLRTQLEEVDDLLAVYKTKAQCILLFSCL